MAIMRQHMYEESQTPENKHAHREEMLDDINRAMQISRQECEEGQGVDISDDDLDAMSKDDEFGTL